MRTKSSIEDLFERTAYVVGVAIVALWHGSGILMDTFGTKSKTSSRDSITGPILALRLQELLSEHINGEEKLLHSMLEAVG